MVRRVAYTRGDSSVRGLKFRLLAALSGFTVTFSWVGLSKRTLPDRGGSGSSGTDTTAGSGGGGAPPAVGGSSPASGAGGAGPRATLGCTAAGDFAAGLEACDGSFVHRTSALACPQSAHDESWENAGAGGEAGAAAHVTCHDDADCRARANAYCVRAAVQFPGVVPYCQSSCETDSDCASGQICSCDAADFVSFATRRPITLGICTSATCSTDADCQAGLLCIAPSMGVCGPIAARDFHCQSASDECSGVADCGQPVSGTFGCEQNEEGNYVCQSAACGRPFLVAGSPRRSAACTNAAWRDRTLTSCPTPSVLDDAVRAVVSDHFLAAALMEHASIAAFARFSLQLLALGAPPDLVAASAQAMADETRHAELCFELASRYAGRDYGPGPLALDGAFEAVDLASVVELVFAEGCVGETAAALEATWAAEAATEPLVREVLAQIAADEERHAALAFRFVSWALARDPRLCDHLRAQLRALATPPPAHALDAATQPLAPELAAHGVLSAEQHRAARSAALHAIVPALLASFEASGQRKPGAAPSAHAAIRA